MDERKGMNQDKPSAPKSKKCIRNIKIKRGMEPTIAICLSIIMIVAIMMVFNGLVGNGATALASKYSEAYNKYKDATYNERYNSYKNSVEKKYHVSNRVSVYIDSLKEEQKLEVLKVSDVEFVVENRNDNDGKVVSWLEVPGEGTFVVNLKAAEFIIDNERAHVLVRVPYPELTNVKIDYSNVQKILFKDDIFNGSYREGEDLARKQLSDADALIKKEFASNQNFYFNAQKAAISSIETLVKQLNPKVDDLQVEVEFY